MHKVGTCAALVLALAALQACSSKGEGDPAPAISDGTEERAPSIAPGAPGAPADLKDGGAPDRSASASSGDAGSDGGASGVDGAAAGGVDAGADVITNAGTTFNGACPGFTTTVLAPLDWSLAGNLRFDTYNQGRLGDDGVLVASFTTGSSPGYDGASVRVGYVYWPADQELNPKTMVVSKDPPACDLMYGAGWGRSGSSTSGLPFSYGVDSPFGYQRLDPNTTYYVTIANKVGGANTCTSGKCEFRLEISRSGGI